MNDEF
jgi:hypothetical protein